MAECNRVRKKYCPELFQDFEDTQDPRHQSYIEYSNRELPGTLLYKGIAGIGSMQSMTYEFNKETTARNLSIRKTYITPTRIAVRLFMTVRILM